MAVRERHYGAPVRVAPVTGPEFSDPLMPTPAPSAGHDGPKCGVPTKRTGKPCGQHAGRGTDHVGIGACKMHLGNSPSHRKAAQEKQAREQAIRLGVPVVTTGAAAVEFALALAHGQMLVAAQIVAALPPERLVVLDKSGTTRATGEVAFFQEALRDYARQAKDVVGLGLDAQRLQLEERRVDVLIQVLQRVLGQVQQQVEGRLGHSLPELAGEVVGPMVHAAIVDLGGEVTG